MHVRGSLLRDVLVREEPLVFKPGQFYLVAAVFGCCLFVGLAIFRWLVSAGVGACRSRRDIPLPHLFHHLQMGDWSGATLVRRKSTAAP
jgi:hypothetical protein